MLQKKSTSSFGYDLIKSVKKNMNKTIYERIFTKLHQIIDLDKLLREKYLKYKSAGYMDLNIDFLRYKDGDTYIISIAHNFTQNGDLMCDPDMEIRIFPKTEMAEALTFQLDSIGIFQRVYQDNKVNIEIKKDLNRFLDKWLTNIKSQKYSLS